MSPTAPHTLRIGTRGSPLAVAQTELFIAALQKHYADLTCEIVKIVTSGDLTQTSDKPLSESGNKGLFTKEIEEALIKGEIDCAVHSMKDMPTVLPDGLIIPCLLPREDVRDAFFSPKAKTLMDLPSGAVVGTSSLRRQALVLARRPDLKVVSFRGNVGTRIKKLEDGQVDATILAVAGLNRLGKAGLAQSFLDPDVMLPAVAQGAVGIETRADDKATQQLIAVAHCPVTELRISAERAFLHVMDGSCKTPLAALLSVPDADKMAEFKALSATPDGKTVVEVFYREKIETREDAVRLGTKAGLALKEQQARQKTSA